MQTGQGNPGTGQGQPDPGSGTTERAGRLQTGRYRRRGHRLSTGRPSRSARHRHYHVELWGRRWRYDRGRLKGRLLLLLPIEWRHPLRDAGSARSQETARRAATLEAQHMKPALNESQ